MKQVRDTSAAAYRDHIQPSLNRREQIVLDALQQYTEPPTGYELTETLKARGLVQDVNGCRPRLTALLAKQRVQLGPKRKCRITNRTVYTWAPSTPKPTALEPVPQRLAF